MKLGLLADVHEAVEPLSEALRTFRQEGVDQVLVLGDVFETGARIRETCRLLADAGAIGVYGNHDFGLCVDPTADVRARYAGVVQEFMATLGPRLEFAGCLLTHVEPWLDPNRIEDLWYFGGIPQTPAQFQRIFQAVPHALVLGGHMHQWLLVTPDRLEPWQGDCPLQLAPDRRYFVVVDALCNGSFAILDTDSRRLTPLHAG